MIAKFRSRKWILTILVFLATCGFTLLGKLTGDMTQIFIALVVSYNAAQGIVDMLQGKNNS